jgi:ribosomal protein L37AE/L43A
MSDLKKIDLAHRQTKRCPVCFSREMDVLLVPQAHDIWACVKCSFQGTEGEIRGMYRDIQKKYHGMLERYTLEDQRKL